MKYMIKWQIPTGTYQASIERFLKQGAPPPPGMKTVGRWHAPGSTYGWHLVEGNDSVALAQHVAEWAALIELEVTPVIEDADAANALSKVYGK